MALEVGKPKLRFIHLRNWDSAENLMPHGGYTIGWCSVNGDIHFAYSQCSLADNYNKKIGRNIVTGRLSSGDYRIIPCVEQDLIHDELTTWVLQHASKRTQRNADLCIEA